MLRDKLLMPEAAQSSASPGVPTPPNQPAGTVSPADSAAPPAAPDVSMGTPPKSSPDFFETRPAGTKAGSPEADLSSLLDDDDELEVGGASDEPAPTPPAVTAKSDKPEPTPPVSPAVELKAPTPPVVTAPPAPVVAPAPVVQPLAPSLEEQETEWRNMRQKAEEQLVRTYELSKDDSDALMVDPGKVFPKLAAKIHLQAFEAAMQTMARNVPGLITGVITQQAQATALKEKFFTKFPALRQHEDLAGKFIVAYRNAAGQGANPDDIANQAGVAAYVHLRLPLEGLPGVILPTAQPAATPAPQPFTPAPTAAGAIPTEDRQVNAFTQMAEEFIKDDS